LDRGVLVKHGDVAKKALQIRREQALGSVTGLEGPIEEGACAGRNLPNPCASRGSAID
jgi:hypothetical protein